MLHTKNILKYKKGMTLLEIVLVIAVIGIFSSIALVAINPNLQFTQTRNLIRRSDITNIYNALEYYNLKNKESINTITEIYQEICDTGSRSINDPLPNPDYCNGKVDLRVLVPTYLDFIPKDKNATVSSETGYEVAKTNSNQMSVRSNKAELDELIVINPIPAPTIPEPPVSIDCQDKPGYIKVPGNPLYGTLDFCVMKYEAKDVGGVATSQASGFPWTFINHSTAITQCQNTGLPGSDLISNAEWMTIARNIELQNSNWYNPTPTPVNQVGNGGLWKGHSGDDNPPNALAASTDDNLGYIGTNNSISNGWQAKRTHTLSNGEVIWDFSGNVWEWNKDTIMGNNKPNYNNLLEFQEWTLFNSSGSYGGLSYDLTRSSNSSWTAAQNNIGKYDPGNFTGGPYPFRRGGDWDGGDQGGIFSLSFNLTRFATQYDTGFRCVIRSSL
jgi:prepilin-type N-terminal cleavage/methylation domain-containing protein